jgi:hypothetical protein
MTNFNMDVFNDKLNDDFVKLSNEFNLLFKNANIDIKNSLNKDFNIKTRNNKLSFLDALCYYFNYSFIDNTKLEVVSDYNVLNDKTVHMSNYQKKEAKIPLSFYQKIFLNIKNLFDKYKSSDNLKIKILVDGTYNNINNNNNGLLETSLNIGYYDFNNRIPIDIQFRGQENKNKEMDSFINYIENNKMDIDNLIFVFDRAYFSYDFINYLDNKNISYVIRTRNNSLYLDKNKIKKEKRNIDKNVKKINNKNIRFITFNDRYTFIKKDRNNNNIKLERTIECNVVTNLSLKDYNDLEIKKIYISRWDIEVFFKLLKSNFKFSNLKEHTKNTLGQYKKLYCIILIQIYIMRLIEIIYDKNINDLNKHKFNKKNKNQYVVKHNNSLMIKGLKLIINSIIKSNINSDLLLKYSKNYMKKINIQINVYKERKCKNPSCKWYIKSYAEYYKYIKIIDTLVNNKLESLNKNLKLMASEIKIIK